MEYVMRYKGKYTEPEQYENIIIKAQNDGSILRLKDVAKVEFGAYSYGSSSKFDRKGRSNDGCIPNGRVQCQRGTDCY